MDNFREWLSDNLRYILLGLAIILILVIAVVAVKFVSSLGDTDNTKSAKTTETQSVSAKDVIVETNADSKSNELIKNDPKILEAVQSYYAAMDNKNIDAMKKIVPGLTAEEEQSIQNNTLIESHENISCYSKSGSAEGSYVAYIVFDSKVANIEPMVPSLVMLYFQANEDGSLYVLEPDEETKKLVEELNNEPAVKTLVDDVNQRYKQVVDANEDLKKIVDEMEAMKTESNIPDSSNAGVEVNKIVAANTECNVRADSTEEADILGVLSEGETVTRVRMLDNGWSEVRYGEHVGYVMSQFLTEQTSDSGAAQ